MNRESLLTPGPLGLTARCPFGRHPPRFQGGDGARANGALTAVSSGLNEPITAWATSSADASRPAAILSVSRCIPGCWSSGRLRTARAASGLRSSRLPPGESAAPEQLDDLAGGRRFHVLRRGAFIIRLGPAEPRRSACGPAPRAAQRSAERTRLSSPGGRPGHANRRGALPPRRSSWAGGWR